MSNAPEKSRSISPLLSDAYDGDVLMEIPAILQNYKKI